MAVFILEDALSVSTNLGVWLFVSSIKTGTRRIIRLDELFHVVRRSRRTTEDNPPRRIMRLVPVFILETNNQANSKYLLKFVQTDNASSGIKTANVILNISTEKPCRLKPDILTKRTQKHSFMVIYTTDYR